jgi:hypothetical protein
MRRTALFVVATGLVGCAGHQTPEGAAPTPVPESVAEATGEIREVVHLTTAEQAALQVARIRVTLKPPAIYEGDTARVEVSYRDATEAPVPGVTGQIFAESEVASITPDGRRLIGRHAGETNVVVIVAVPATGDEPAHTIRERAALHVRPASVRRVELAPAGGRRPAVDFLG